MPTAEAPLSSRADAQAGRGMVTGREAPEARDCWLLLLPTPVPCQHSLATQRAWVRAMAQEQWREVDGNRAPREGALGPREEEDALPPTTPH